MITDDDNRCHYLALKSLPALFRGITFADLECLLKKTQYCQNNPKNSFVQRKKLTINLQDTHGVQYAHLMVQKTNAIFIGERVVFKSFVKI